MKLRATVLLAVLVGVLAGLGGYTFLYAEGFSYMSSDPRACVNCHIMRSEYDSWQKGSHHSVATCIDCHLPHGFIGKWMAKAENGFHHSKAFTLQDFHEPIMIKPESSRVLQASCMECHGPLVDDLVVTSNVSGDEVTCVHCHASVGHGDTTGLGR